MKHFFEIIFIFCLYFPLPSKSSLLEEVDENFIPITHSEDIAIGMETFDSTKHPNEIANKEPQNEASSSFKFWECFQRTLPIALQVTLTIIGDITRNSKWKAFFSAYSGNAYKHNAIYLSF